MAIKDKKDLQEQIKNFKKLSAEKAVFFLRNNIEFVTSPNLNKEWTDAVLELNDKYPLSFMDEFLANNQHISAETLDKIIDREQEYSPVLYGAAQNKNLTEAQIDKILNKQKFSDNTTYQGQKIFYDCLAVLSKRIKTEAQEDLLLNKVRDVLNFKKDYDSALLMGLFTKEHVVEIVDFDKLVKKVPKYVVLDQIVTNRTVLTNFVTNEKLSDDLKKDVMSYLFTKIATGEIDNRNGGKFLMAHMLANADLNKFGDFIEEQFKMLGKAKERNYYAYLGENPNIKPEQLDKIIDNYGEYATRTNSEITDVYCYYLAKNPQFTVEHYFKLKDAILAADKEQNENNKLNPRKRIAHEEILNILNGAVLKHSKHESLLFDLVENRKTNGLGNLSKEVFLNKKVSSEFVKYLVDNYLDKENYYLHIDDVAKVKETTTEPENITKNLAHLASYSTSYVLIEKVAENPKTPVSVLNEIAGKNYLADEAILRNPNAPRDVLENVYENILSKWERYLMPTIFLLENPNADEKLLLKVAETMNRERGDSFSSLVKYISDNPNVTNKVLKELVKREDEMSVRAIYKVVTNDKIQSDVLDVLAKSDNPFVRNFAKENPNFKPSLSAELDEVLGKEQSKKKTQTLKHA